MTGPDPTEPPAARPPDPIELPAGLTEPDPSEAPTAGAPDPTGPPAAGAPGLTEPPRGGAPDRPPPVPAPPPAPPAPPVTSPTGPRRPAYQVGSSAIGLWALQSAISAVLLLGVVLVVAVLVADDWPGWLRTVAGVAPYVVLAYGLFSTLVLPRLRYRIHRWEVTGSAVHTRTGWLDQEWTIVPVARIQTVDVHRGALQRLFGLASVAVLTASSKGTVHIVHLPHDVATRVADDLAARAALVRDEAT